MPRPNISGKPCSPERLERMRIKYAAMSPRRKREQIRRQSRVSTICAILNQTNNVQGIGPNKMQIEAAFSRNGRT